MKIARIAGVIFDKIIDVFLAVAAVMIVVDALAVAQDVILRKTASLSWTGLFEVMEYTMVWFPFLGATWLLRKEGHVRMEAVVSRLNPRSLAVMNVVASIIAAITLMIVTYFTAKLTIHDFQQHYNIASIIDPPKGPIEMIIPIGCFMLFIQLCRNIHKHLISLKTMPVSN